MHKKAGTRAGNHQRHTQQTQQRCASHKQGNSPTTPLYMHLTNTPHSHHTAPCATEAPDTDTGATAAGTRAAHIQLKARRWGNPPAPARKPRRGSAGALGQETPVATVGSSTLVVVVAQTATLVARGQVLAAKNDHTVMLRRFLRRGRSTVYSK